MDSSREKLFDFAALCLWLIMSVAMAGYVFFEFGQDFRGYYAAARVLLKGGNPYDYSLVSQVLLDVTGIAGNNPFYYPLWFGWFITPLSLLPFQTARMVWMAFNWGIWIFGLIRLRLLLGFPRPGWRTWMLNLAATFIFAWTTWKFEQTGILLFFIAVEILIAYKQHQWNQMGLYLTLALIKPNLMLVPVFALSTWLIRNKKWRPVIVGLTILIALVLLTTILTPDWYQPFFRPNFGQGLTDVLDGPDRVTGVRLNTTLLDWLKWFGIPPAIRNMIYAIVLLAAVGVLSSKVLNSGSFMDVAVTSLLVTFTITPYALQYDYPPLVIVLFWALAISKETSQCWIPIILVGFLTSVLIWERPISDGYWIVIGLAILSYWGSTQSRRLEFKKLEISSS